MMIRIAALLLALATPALTTPALAEVNIQEVTSPGGIKAWLVEEHGIPFTALDIRFAAPVYPGETLVTEIWRVPGQPTQVQLRARVLERDKVVLSHGFAELA